MRLYASQAFFSISAGLCPLSMTFYSHAYSMHLGGESIKSFAALFASICTLDQIEVSEETAYSDDIICIGECYFQASAIWLYKQKFVERSPQIYFARTEMADFYTDLMFILILRVNKQKQSIDILHSVNENLQINQLYYFVLMKNTLNIDVFVGELKQKSLEKYLRSQRR